MNGNKIINQYFREFEKTSKCEIEKYVTGSKYSFLDQHGKSKLLRFFMDNNLDASISGVKSNKTYLFKYVDKSDLLIIGFCLEGKKTIYYRGENIIEKDQLIKVNRF